MTKKSRCDGEEYLRKAIIPINSQVALEEVLFSDCLGRGNDAEDRTR